ncbi:MAG: metallophosphoesterase family protein [Actinomycetota bacterium]
MRSIHRAVFFLVVALVTTAFAAQPVGASSVTIAAAGDISRASLGGPPQQTANLISSLNPSAVFALGDTQYPDGSLSDFQSYYDKSWGAFKNKTYPIPGNHEYQTPGAAGFYGYFGTGSAVPVSSPGYYSVNLGDWHIAFINTNCAQIDCTAEKTWLKNDLTGDSHVCDMVVYHNTNLKWPRVRAEKFGVDIGLAASRHVYERWPAENGLTRFTVGTGGYSLGTLSSGFDAGFRTYGVISMTLNTGGYSWAFINTSGTTLDQGTRSCH